MRRVFSVLFVSVFILFYTCITACAEEINLSAQAYVLYCVENDTVLLSENAHKKMNVASTTKILSALLALEKSEISDEIVEFKEEMIAEGSSMYLKVGDSVHLSDLAKGMLIASGNDAANATACAISGNNENFAKLMNKRAKAIGMKNSHFVTPSGLDAKDHYSTAYDMALLMKEALQNEQFCDITKNTVLTIDFLTPQKQVEYHNHNRLLSLYDYCISGKTGYTLSSGRCLVTAAKKDGLTLICVTLNDKNDWNDHIKMYDYGFENFEAVKSDFRKRTFIDVVGGNVDTVELYTKDNKSAVVKMGEKKNVVRTVHLYDFLYAPVKSDECVGAVIHTLNGKVILSTPIYTKTAIKRQSESAFSYVIRKIFK